MDQPTAPDDLDEYGNKARDVWTLRGIVLAPARCASPWQVCAVCGADRGEPCNRPISKSG